MMRITVVLVLVCWAQAVFALDGRNVTISRSVIESRIDALASKTDLGKKQVAELSQLYRQALDHLEAESAYRAAIGVFTEAQKSTAGKARRIREAAAKKQRAITVAVASISADTSLTEIDAMVQKAKADLAADSARLNGYRTRLEKEDGRPTAIRQRLIAIRLPQDRLAEAAQPVADNNAPPALVEARRWNNDAHLAELRAEVKMLDIELLSQPMRVELLKAEQEEVERNVAVYKERVAALTKLLNDRRVAEAEVAKSDAEAAMLDAADKAPIIRQQAERNARLSEELKEIAGALEDVKGETSDYSAKLERLGERFKNTRQKLSVAGVSQALGQVLAAHRRELDGLGVSRSQVRVRERLMAEAGLREIRYKEERRAGRDRAAYLGALAANSSEAKFAEVADELAALVEQRMTLLDQAIGADGAYLRSLGELDFVHRQLLNAVEEYRVFLDENLIWIRSTPPVKFADFAAIPADISRIVSPATWVEVGRRIAQPTERSPFIVLALLAYLFVRWKARWWNELIATTGKNVDHVATDTISNTIAALAFAFLSSLPIPLVMLALAGQLDLSANGHDLSLAVSSVLGSLWSWVLAFGFFRRVAAKGGIAAVHFRWPASSLQVLRKELNRALYYFVPLIALFVISQRADSITLEGMLSKLFFVSALLTLSFSLSRLLHLNDGIFAPALKRNSATWYARLAPVWVAVIVGAPIAFAGLVLVGYIYTAGILMRHYIYTLWLITVAILVEQLAVRWLTLTARRLTRQAALDRFAAQRAAREAQAAESGDEGELFELEEPQVDVVTLGADSRKLVHATVLFGAIAGVWLTWSDTFLALGVLEGFTLWTISETVDGHATRIAVSLADLGLAALIAIATVIMTKNLPALIEIILRQRLRMTRGSLYAVGALTTYTLVTIGIILVFNVLGGRWSQIQWLVAALGVGIGFGLQEIVANFISGLIILFERPIRVGDVVTVGDIDGVVTKIRIRATTIRNWDRKELIVPNKEFITGRLLNWSLSDSITRIHFYVGVAYGADVERAMALIAEAAEENEHVLKDPSPFVTFESFGDNALNLGLRCYVDSIEIRLSTTTELHIAINHKFNAAGIVIAFPQRDLHLDTLGPLEISIRRDSES